MLKKTAIYLTCFLALLLLNIFLPAKLSEKLNRDEKAKKILSEIEEENNIARQFNYSNAPFSTGPFKTEVKTTDGRSANLKIFFRKHNSPLYDFADKIVRESDKNGFDYR